MTTSSIIQRVKMKNIKFTLLIKVLLGNLANDYELGYAGFKNQTTSNIQEDQIGRSRMPGRKNTTRPIVSHQRESQRVFLTDRRHQDHR